MVTLLYYHMVPELMLKHVIAMLYTEIAIILLFPSFQQSVKNTEMHEPVKIITNKKSGNLINWRFF